MSTEKGVKLDSGKVDVSLVFEYFPRALVAVSQVSEFGAKKYARGGWVTVLDGIGRYTAAHDRHRLAEEIEGPYDLQDSNLLHAAQVAWNALARLELMLKEGRQVCLDDASKLPPQLSVPSETDQRFRSALSNVSPLERDLRDLDRF